MRRTRSTLVRDVASRQVVTVTPETTLAQCARRMRDEHVGSVVVLDTEGARARAIGIVTDRDIVMEAVAQSLDPTALTAAEVMATPLGTVSEDDDVIDALARMRELGVRRLVSRAAGGEVAGIIALDDVLAALAEQLAAVVDVSLAERTKENETRPAR